MTTFIQMGPQSVLKIHWDETNTLVSVSILTLGSSPPCGVLDADQLQALGESLTHLALMVEANQK